MNDNAPYLEVKKARIARAGRQTYLASEMKTGAEGFKDSGKSAYVQFRPPEVLLKNIDKFNNVVFVNDHTPTDVTPENWKDYAIGFVGGNAGFEFVEDELWITNDVVFYDRKAYDEYKAGKVELSASYDARLEYARDPEREGYDSVLVDIPAVNHVALCDRARAGRGARILDSADVIDKEIGGTEMSVKVKSGLLSAVFGIGKNKDAGFKFSDVLMGSVAKMKTLDAGGVEKEVGEVMAHVVVLGDSEARELLAGTVGDCFKHAEAVLSQKDAVAKKIDELYGRCQAADAETVKRILDADAAKDDDKDKRKDGDGDDKDKKKDGDGKNNDAQPKDVDAVVDAAFAKAVAKLSDSIEDKIGVAVAKALGLDEKAGKPGAAAKPGDGRQDDSTGSGEDASYLMRGIFGAR